MLECLLQKEKLYSLQVIKNEEQGQWSRGQTLAFPVNVMLDFCNYFRVRKLLQL